MEGMLETRLQSALAQEAGNTLFTVIYFDEVNFFGEGEGGGLLL